MVPDSAKTETAVRILLTPTTCRYGEGFMELFKYQALGNDYLLYFDAWDESSKFSDAFVKWVCDRHFGIGSDGFLYGYRKEETDDFRLKIFNPDASVAEKSGNGVRIFAKFLLDHYNQNKSNVTITTASGKCFCEKSGDKISVDMGVPQFTAPDLPTPNEQRITIKGEEFAIIAVSMGNPHCVIFTEHDVPEAYVKRVGPLIECCELFPKKTNVQFAHVISPEQIHAKIWERGAGYTLSSGSSACAIFAAAYKKKFCRESATVKMPGGSLQMKFSANKSIIQCGEVEYIARCIV